MMFQKLDPRVRLLWWGCIITISMFLRSETTYAVLIFSIYLAWQSANLRREFIRFAVGMIWIILIVTLVSLFPTFDLQRAIAMGMRFFAIGSSTMLILRIIPQQELTEVLRHLKPRRLKFLDKPMEILSFVLGLAFSTVPNTEQEWLMIKELQRARGIDLERGGKINQVKKGLSLLQPLLLRTFERTKYLLIAVILFGYNPFEIRTSYIRMNLDQRDKIAGLIIVTTSAIAISLAFIFKV